MESRLTKKIIKRIFFIIVILNFIFTAIISYSIINNYNKNVISSMENINISSNVILKSTSSKDDISNTIKVLEQSYDIEGYVKDHTGKTIIGSPINIDIKRFKDIDYASNTVINVSHTLTKSYGITINSITLNNKLFGELILVKDFSEEYSNTLFTIVTIIISQIVIIFLLLKLVAKYIKKSLSPLEVLNDSIVRYGKGEEIGELQISTDDEIEELYNSFIDMSRDITNEKRKTVEFFNNATHELKTPITAISGYIQALSSKPIEEVKKDFRDRAFYRVRKESDKLIVLIEKLLDISRGAVKKNIVLEEVDVSLVLEECLQELDERLSEFKIDKSVESKILVSNKEDIKMIIFNLLDNAIKYSKSNYIKVDVLNSNTSIFEIENETYPIPEDKRDMLLEPFIKYDYNLESDRELKVSSSGLGLYLCSTLAKENRLKLEYNIEDNKIRFMLIEE